MKRPYTEAEILKAIRLFEEIGSWPEVAELLDRTPGSLQVTVCKYRAGRWAPDRLHERSQVLYKRIEIWVAEGRSTGEMAQEAGLTKSSVQCRLTNLGFDVDSRRRLAREAGRDLSPFRRSHARVC